MRLSSPLRPLSLVFPTFVVLSDPALATPELTLEMGAVLLDPKNLDRSGVDPSLLGASSGDGAGESHRCRSSL